MITVTTVCWKRFKHFDQILKTWLAEPEVDEVIVWDNSGKFKTDILGVLVIGLSRNVNSKWRLLSTHLAKNDDIIITDDDIMPKPGICKDLLRYYNEENMVGIMGKKFTGDTYYASAGIRANGINRAMRVDYLCMNLLMIHRAWCRIDIREIPSSLMVDWWWQHEIDIPMYVVPTDKWEMLPEGEYEFSQHLDPRMKPMREKYFKQWGYDKRNQA
jgi:hypothetical protein